VWLNGGDGESWTRLPASTQNVRPFYLSWSPNSSSTREMVALPPVDFTDDAFPDMVECQNNQAAPTTCTVHRGLGDGTFLDSYATFTVDQNVNGFALADFNGDGTVDMLGGFDDDGDAGQAWLWATDPTNPTYPSGTGVPSLDVNLPDSGSDSDSPGYGWPYPYDWDDDGDMDVLVSVHDPWNSTDRTIWVGLNDGAANFTAIEVGTTTHGWGSSGSSELIQDLISVPVWP